MNIGPLVFKEIFAPRPWGGRFLARYAGKRLPPRTPIGESWEISNENVVSAGPLAGRKLKDLVASDPAGMVGDARAKRFPLLVKLLSPNQWLSLQVHPDDACARAMGLGPNGKTEAWHILRTGAASELIIGLKRGAALDGLAAMARNGEIAGLLERVRPKPGETWFCPAGTVHAVGPGVMILEVQQNADVTFRLYDWGRMGLDGKPRQLHVDEAVRATGGRASRMTRPPPKVLRGLGFPAARHVACDKFVLDVWDVREAAAREKPGRFEVLHVLEGAGRLCGGFGPDVALRRGLTALIPAALRTYRIVSTRALKIARAADVE